MSRIFQATFFAFCLAVSSSAFSETVDIKIIASDLNHPWSVAFLPDGRFLVSERSGNLRTVTADGDVSHPIAGLPEIHSSGQGGLLDLMVDPAFVQNNVIYFSFSAVIDGGNATALAKARLVGSSLENVQVLFTQSPAFSTSHHYGSRIRLGTDGKIYLSSGDRGQAELAQSLSHGQGKVFRIDPQGKPLSDNPFTAQSDAISEIWSYGHRNIQGMAIHPVSGAIWIHEHGARGGDEVNIIQRGANYGWPLVSHGVNYNYTPIGTGRKLMKGITAPIYTWVPSIAPSGMSFYTGNRYPQWKNSLFVGALAGRMLVRLELDGDKIKSEHRLMQDFGKRIRDVKQGSDGYLYVVTDESRGQLLRVGAAKNN